MVGLVWFGRIGLVGSLVPLKVAKASLELHLGTIPVGVGWGRVGPIVIIRLSQFNCNCNCLLELSLAILSTNSDHYSTASSFEYHLNFDMSMKKYNSKISIGLQF